ncbi:MAG: HAMP domain-containing sensor histidine kinase [bacterium]
MNKKSLVIYLLLFFLPTVFIGVTAFRILQNEQKRINQQVRFTAMDRARVIANDIELSIITVKDALKDSLSRMPGESLRDKLYDLEESNPLVYNVFIYEQKKGLLLPPADNPVTSREKEFMARYNGLFSGRISWYTEGTLKENGTGIGYGGKEQPLKSAGQLREVAKNVLSSKRSPGEEQDIVTGNGWIPWFWEDKLYLLGWIQKTKDGPVYGVEIETMYLLSRILPGLSTGAPAGIVFGLLNEKGKLVHQIGRDMIEENKMPDSSISLAPVLPHWEIGIYFTGAEAPGYTQKSFLIIGSLILSIFLTAILSGGTLLLWQAHHNMVDARQKTSFVSNVSHELKTPLTTIRMYAELMKEGRIKNQDKIQDYLNVIVSESQRLTRLVNNVLDFSRLEQGRKKYHLEKIDIIKCINDILETQEPRIKEAGMFIKKNLPEAPILVDLDRDAFEQVLLNIIDNAVKYASGGKEFELELNLPGDLCELKIMDRGTGIPAGQKEKIFEKFYRVDNSLTTRHPGSGLGLSITKRLLNDLGGDIIYETREGGGACFIIKLWRRK